MVHIHDKYDFVVGLYVLYKDKVLLANHPRYDMWLPLGGHIELDEEPEEAVLREAKEECGLDVTILNDKELPKFKASTVVAPPRYIDVHYANEPHKHICLIYYVQAKTDKYKLSSEHNQLKWLGLEDLDKPQYNLTDAIKFYARDAIASSKASSS